MVTYIRVSDATLVAVNKDGMISFTGRSADIVKSLIGVSCFKKVDDWVYFPKLVAKGFKLMITEYC